MLEHLPLIGLVFSISNRVGAAMYAHDLEKRQQLFVKGEVKKLKKGEAYGPSLRRDVNDDWGKPGSDLSRVDAGVGGSIPGAPKLD